MFLLDLLVVLVLRNFVVFFSSFLLSRVRIVAGVSGVPKVSFFLYDPFFTRLIVHALTAEWIAKRLYLLLYARSCVFVLSTCCHGCFVLLLLVEAIGTDNEHPLNLKTHTYTNTKHSIVLRTLKHICVYISRNVLWIFHLLHGLPWIFLLFVWGTTLYIFTSALAFG